ncbi:MAG: hypothetical protein H0V89_06295, partial [Deltaproteobacteria bacterium]|nr:hypothetical protein [Deltaproteobacteria bacterium]
MRPRILLLALCSACLWIGPDDQADRLDGGAGGAIDLRIGEIPTVSLG